MINATNINVQTIAPNENVLFSNDTVRTKSSKGCCGWLNHTEGSGIFTITKPGNYIVHFNANVAPTVAGAITVNITNSGESITGGQMQTPGTTVDVFENIAAEVGVCVPCNSSVIITVKNNTPTNAITMNNPSIVITRDDGNE